jgi:hypothetical protein
MRRLVLVVAALFAVGCVASAAARDPRAETLKLNARDGRAARGALLTLADLSAGWRHDKASNDDTVPSCSGYNPDFSQFVITGRAEADYQHPAGAWVKSEAEVYASHADASGDFRRGARPQLAHCLAILLEKQGAGDPSVRIKVLSSRMVAAPRLGERAARYKVSARFSGPSRSVTMYMDFIAFQQGRALGTVFTMSVSQPIRDGVSLARTMLARVR